MMSSQLTAQFVRGVLYSTRLSAYFEVFEFIVLYPAGESDTAISLLLGVCTHEALDVPVIVNTPETKVTF